MSEAKTAAVVVIGNEILTGRTQDTNTSWIAERLTKHGIRLAEVRVVPDFENTIIRTINELRPHFDFIFTTGGIGPTHDDITAESIAKAFETKLEKNKEAYQILEDHYGAENFTDARVKMAYIPVGASLIPNPVSAAPGFILENVHVMAGVPKIMQAMFDHILEGVDAGAPILSSTVACKLQESVIAPSLSALQDKYDDIQIGSYPHYKGGILGLSLVLRGTNTDDLNKATNELIRNIRDLGDEPRALTMEAWQELGDN